MRTSRARGKIAPLLGVAFYAVSLAACYNKFTKVNSSLALFPVLQPNLLPFSGIVQKWGKASLVFEPAKPRKTFDPITASGPNPVSLRGNHATSRQLRGTSYLSPNDLYVGATIAHQIAHSPSSFLLIILAVWSDHCLHNHQAIDPLGRPKCIRKDLIFGYALQLFSLY